MKKYGYILWTWVRRSLPKAICKYSFFCKGNVNKKPSFAFENKSFGGRRWSRRERPFFENYRVHGFSQRPKKIGHRIGLVLTNFNISSVIGIFFNFIFIHLKLYIIYMIPLFKGNGELQLFNLPGSSGYLYGQLLVLVLA